MIKRVPVKTSPNLCNDLLPACRELCYYFAMLIALIKAMRPKQWAKNVMIFAALVFDRKLGVPSAMLDTIIGAVLFSLLASSIYLLNDIADIEADRQHPKKKNRPIASGKLPIWAAWTSAGILLLVVFPSAYWLSPEFAVLCGIYFFLNLAYSFWLKHIPIVDVIGLASFYVLRVAAGVFIIEVDRFSPWLYLAMIFLALFMGIGKRRAELITATETGQQTRKVLQAYTLPYLDQLINIVLTATILTYSLYTFSAPNLPDNHITMLTIPFVIYGVFRYLHLMQVQGRGEAPEEIVLSDRPFQINMALWGGSILAIFYFF